MLPSRPHFAKQLSLPLVSRQQALVKDMRGSGSAGPLREPARGVARIAAQPQPQPGGI